MVSMSVRLRFGEIFTEVENCRKREEVEEVDDVIAKESAAAAEGISSKSRRTVDRSGRPSAEAAERSTVHKHARGVAVDRPGRPQKENGRPPGRPTESA